MNKVNYKINQDEINYYETFMGLEEHMNYNGGWMNVNSCPSSSLPSPPSAPSTLISPSALPLILPSPSSLSSSPTPNYTNPFHPSPPSSLFPFSSPFLFPTVTKTKMNKVYNNEISMWFSKRKNNNKINTVDSDGWMNSSVGINELRMDRDDVIEDDYLWSDGTVKMWDLKANKIVPPIKSPIKFPEVDDHTIFNNRMEVEIKEYNDLKFMNSLPKFSVVRLEKMKKFAEKEALSIRPLRPWEGQQTTTSTSRTAFGHRRNGGGQKPPTLAQMNSPAYIAKQRARHNRQNLNNKKKSEIETSEREVLMVRLNAQRALYLLDTASMKGADVEVVNVNTEDIVLAEKMAALHKFKNDEIAFFNAKVNSFDFDSNMYLPNVKVVTPKVVETEWITIDKTMDKKKVKRDKDMNMLVTSLYKKTLVIDSLKIAEAALNPFISMVIEKVSWKKSKPATLMCRSVVNGEKCPHPVGKCNFAHTTEDLNPKNCVNKCCRFVKKLADKFVNKGNKICTFLHEGEVKSNLCIRIGMKFVQPVVKVVINEKQPLWVTPMSDRVLKRYSSELAWGPVM